MALAAGREPNRATAKPVQSAQPGVGFGVSPVLLAPTVGAWGLLRLGAQKQKRERQTRQGAGAGLGGEFRAAEHEPNLALGRGSVQANVMTRMLSFRIHRLT